MVPFHSHILILNFSGKKLFSQIVWPLWWEFTGLQYVCEDSFSFSFSSESHFQLNKSTRSRRKKKVKNNNDKSERRKPKNNTKKGKERSERVKKVRSEYKKEETKETAGGTTVTVNLDIEDKDKGNKADKRKKEESVPKPDPWSGEEAAKRLLATGVFSEFSTILVAILNSVDSRF